MSDNPAKDALFALLESARFSAMADEGRYAAIAREAVPAAMDAMGGAMPRGTLLETLATGVLHYVLTRSRTPSQRNIEYDGVEMDVVVPGTRELRRDPGSALVIQIGCDCDALKARLRRTLEVQPVRPNVWCLTQDCGGARAYTISGDGATFPRMVDDVIRFAADRRHDRLGMVP